MAGKKKDISQSTLFDVPAIKTTGAVSPSSTKERAVAVSNPRDLLSINERGLNGCFYGKSIEDGNAEFVKSIKGHL